MPQDKRGAGRQGNLLAIFFHYACDRPKRKRKLGLSSSSSVTKLRTSLNFPLNKK
jgi:hypothetical protein